MTRSVQRKRRITLGPEHLSLSNDAPYRRTEPGGKLDDAVLAVMNSMGVSPTDDSRFQPGMRLAKYELIRELGHGAMGRVFLARDTKLGRRVAIKFLNADHFGDRFMVEARATAKCAHENIVVIHDVSEHEGQPYMVLEYLEGKPLKHYMGRPLSAHRSVELITPVVRAMVQAHEFGIVHRDLKPENIFVTTSGTIKVLDFGIAKLLDHRTVGATDRIAPTNIALRDTAITHDGVILGTMPYMSPEQWRVRDHSEEDVDHRSDIWAVGVILYEMVCGRHPLAPLSRERLQMVTDLDAPMPGVTTRIPSGLAKVIADCLTKRKSERIASAGELLRRLEPLSQRGRRLGEGEIPYAGLTPFQEQDAHRFFGRGRDIVRLMARIHHQPLVALVGSTGVGKSSLIRAGIVPALKLSGERWDVFTLRPGRYPLAGLATLISSLSGPDSDGWEHAARADTESKSRPSPVARQREITAQLRDEPGHLGALLRNRARTHSSRALIFVDQFEELYTLVTDPEERHAFIACLAAIADDTAEPLRVILSMRSDFLDRVAEDREFMELLAGSLMFLAPPERKSLETVLVQPAEMAGYSFEDPQMVDHMLDVLEHSPGALPLLQFTASRLWEVRDRERRLLTRSSYESIGGVAGALASHADDVVAGLSASAQKLTRTIFERLVTPERTRAIASVEDLCQLSEDSETARKLVDQLVQARLLVANKGHIDHAVGDGPTVEIVHESLIDGWPTLRRWLDEDADKAKFLARLKHAAKQWDSMGRADGLLWRGKATVEARNWQGKLDGELRQVEQEYIDAALWLADRSARTRRLLLAATLSLLLALVAAAAIALVWINQAEQLASFEAFKAQQNAQELMDTNQILEDTIRERDRAQRQTELARRELQEKAEELAHLYQQIQKRNAELEAINAQALNAKKDAQEESRRNRQLAKLEQESARNAEVSAQEAAESMQKLQEQKRKEDERKARLKDLVGPYTTTLMPFDEPTPPSSTP